MTLEAETAKCHTFTFLNAPVSPPNPQQAQGRRKRVPVHWTGHQANTFHSATTQDRLCPYQIADIKRIWNLVFGHQKPDIGYRIYQIRDIGCQISGDVRGCKLSGIGYRVGKKHLPAPGWTELSSSYVGKAGTGGENRSNRCQVKFWAQSKNCNTFHEDKFMGRKSDMLRSDLKPECVASRPSRSPPNCGYCIVNIVCMGFLHDHTDLIKISLPVCTQLVLVSTTSHSFHCGTATYFVPGHLTGHPSHWACGTSHQWRDWGEGSWSRTRWLSRFQWIIKDIM